MRPLVALVLVAIVAFTVGALIPHVLGHYGGFVLLLLLLFVLITTTVVGLFDAADRRRAVARLRFRRAWREWNRDAPIVDVAAMPRRIRQGRP